MQHQEVPSVKIAMVAAVISSTAALVALFLVPGIVPAFGLALTIMSALIFVARQRPVAYGLGTVGLTIVLMSAIVYVTQFAVGGAGVEGVERTPIPVPAVLHE